MISIHRVLMFPAARRGGAAGGGLRRRGGFTFVEVLVVVGVLVFFIAMLVPALSKAQRQARTLTCLSNLRQLHLGFTTYVHQNSEHSLGYDPTYASIWTRVLQPMFPDVKGLLFCPEASAPSYGMGTATSAWGPYDPKHGSPASTRLVGGDSSSYGFNGWLYSTPDEPGQSSLWYRHRIADRVPVFAESTWIDGWPTASDILPAIPEMSGGDSGLSRFNLARHGRSINAAFLDGHAEQIPLENLVRLKWSSSSRFDSAGM